MKLIYNTPKYILYLACLLLFGNNLFSQCANGNLEAGNLSNWSTFTSVNNDGSVHLDQLTQQTINGRHTIVASGTDAYGGFPIVPQGNYALRIGNNATGNEIDMAGYTFTVTNANKNFGFKYAMVLQDPTEHTYQQKPGFSWFICRTAGSPSVSNLITAANSNVSVTADRNNVFFKYIGNDIVYKPWTNTCIDLSAYVGQTLTIFFATKDCSQGGHFGYAYVDGLCEDNAPVPSFNVVSMCNNNIIIDASSSQKEDGYFLEVMQSDQNWSTGPAISQWFVPKEAGVIDFKTDFLDKTQFSFLKCNTYYRIKLAVRNDCVGWVDASKLVYLSCVEGSDVASCYPGTTNVTLGTPSNNNNCTWVDNLNNWVGQGATITIPRPRCTTTYKGYSTDINGCYSEKLITVFVHHPVTVNISKQITKPCCGDTYATLKAEMNYLNPSNLCPVEYAQYGKDAFPGFTYQWSTGETTRTINTQDHPGVATFTVTVTNGCGSYSASITINLNTGKNGPIPDLIAPSSMVPGSQDFFIAQYGPTAPDLGTGPAYNATGYKLEIFDRGGISIIRTLEYDPGDNSFCNFINGSIRWDGRTNSGSVVQTGAYAYRLIIYNCTYTKTNGGWKPQRILTDKGWINTPNGSGVVEVIH